MFESNIEGIEWNHVMTILPLNACFKIKWWIYRGILGVLVKNSLNLILFPPISPNFEGNENLRLCLVTVFVFYFQKLVFENIKKKQFSCIFELKMWGKICSKPALGPKDPHGFVILQEMWIVFKTCSHIEERCASSKKVKKKK